MHVNFSRQGPTHRQLLPSELCEIGDIQLRCFQLELYRASVGEGPVGEARARTEQDMAVHRRLQIAMLQAHQRRARVNARSQHLPVTSVDVKIRSEKLAGKMRRRNGTLHRTLEGCCSRKTEWL